jgi:hypothetical protein
MSTRTFRNLLGTLLTATTLMLGGAANAAFYSSSFDPPGPVSFSGTGLFQLDDACLAADGFYTAAACNLTLLSATVDVTDTSTSDTGHLNFASLLPNIVSMVDLIISGGNLVGVNTDLIGSVFASPCTGTICGEPWWIEWGTTSDSDPVFLFTGNCDGDSCFPAQTPIGTAFNVTFTRVPEPGTLALLFVAGGLGWLVRRRLSTPLILAH